LPLLRPAPAGDGTDRRAGRGTLAGVAARRTCGRADCRPLGRPAGGAAFADDLNPD